MTIKTNPNITPTERCEAIRTMTGYLVDALNELGQHTISVDGQNASVNFIANNIHLHAQTLRDESFRTSNLRTITAPNLLDLLASIPNMYGFEVSRVRGEDAYTVKVHNEWGREVFMVCGPGMDNVSVLASWVANHTKDEEDPDD